jgi:hypothetical protein
MLRNFILLIIVLIANTVSSQDSTKPKKWFESIQIRGYAQVRYNRLLETNQNLNCEQCDRSWGANGGFFLRRMRIIFFGQINKQVYFYIQPDFASSVSTTSLHFGQLRDAYFDIGVDKDNEFRFRIGQSKVPYGFENMQSSQNRLTLDRNDAFNSAVSNERDMGVFFYWAPKAQRALFSELVSSGLKGSGDYGVFALGAYNGQTANRPELNDNKHIVGRFSYPHKFKNGQIIEAGIQAYTGKVVLSSITKNVVVINSNNEYIDQRIGATFVLYPKPFGIQAEYNIGKGPEYNTTTNSIDEKNLEGGYILGNYQYKFKNQLIIPFVKYQFYNGGKKHELDARSFSVKELEMGMEWQPNKNFELVAQYTISNRRFEDGVLRNNTQEGNLLRLQAQVNF